MSVIYQMDIVHYRKY